MNHKVLSFGEFINESVKNNILTEILNELDDIIDDMVIKIINSINKQNEKSGKPEATAYDIEMVRLGLIIDLIKSIERYTAPTDELVSITAGKSIKGNIQISAVIKRDGIDYQLETEAIYAGGHNIQVLHYRYITKTNLPPTGGDTMFKHYREKLKKMGRVERLQTDILNYRNLIARTENDVNKNLVATDEEIVAADPYWGRTKDLTWDEIVRRGADKNFDYDPEKFYKSQQEYQERLIDTWRSLNITGKQKSIEGWKKEIKKLEVKLEKEIENIK